MALLSGTELEEGLKELPGWSVTEGRLRREYRFRDFTAAFSFMTAVALQAEKRDHHPDWSNAYNRVTVELTTHDAGGITAKDLALAGEMERLAAAVLRGD